MAVECTSLQNCYAERLKELRAHTIGLNANRVFFPRAAEDMESRSRMPVANDADVVGGHRPDSGKRRELSLQPFEEGGHLRIAIAGARKAETEKQDVVRFEAQRHAIEVDQRVHEEPRAHEQGRRERNLASHKSFVKPKPMPINSGASRFSEPALDVYSRRLPCRCQSEEDAGRK